MDEEKIVPIQVQKNFELGTRAREKTKRISAMAGKVSRRIFLSLCLLTTISVVVPDLKNQAMQEEVVSSEQAQSNVPSSNQVPRQRVIAEDFVLPAGGTIVVQKKMRCHGDNITDENMQHITRTHQGAVTKYASEHDGEVQFKIWFFDEGGDCVSDLQKLIAENALM